MQVSVEKISELSRKMTVSFPDEIIQEKMEARFKSLAREAKIDGFRPGKVPVRVIKKMYADRVRGEITGDLIKKSYLEALQEQNLNPASQPDIHRTDETSGFEYTAEFEVYPDISLDALSTLEIKRPVANIEQADQDAMIAKLREKKKKWNIVDRASKKEDRVTIHFSGVCEGENFTDGKVNDYLVEIGSAQMIPGFEDELIGLEAGTNKTFSISFPEQYDNEKLAGKVAEFEVELSQVEESNLPKIDEEFIKNYGVEDGSVESFNIDIKTNMERELAQGLRGQLRNVVMDTLYEKVKVTVPNALIDQEVQNIMKPYQANAKKQNKKLEDHDLPKELFEEQAKRRMSLGLILGEIIKKNEINLDLAKVRSTIEAMAKGYDSPEDVISWYYSDEDRLNGIKRMVLENQTVDWIVDQAQVSDENISFEEIMEKQSNNNYRLYDETTE